MNRPMAPNQMILTQDTDVLAVERHGSFQDQDHTISDKFTLDGKEYGDLQFLYLF